jgi:hypothetical protein
MRSLSFKIGAILFGIVFIFGGIFVYLRFKESPNTANFNSTSAKTVGKLMIKTGTYEGDIRGGKANGQGTLTYANGNVYVGEFKDNKKEGQGTLTTLFNGVKGVYVGGFANDQKTGKGYITLTYSDGWVYKGDFKDLPNASDFFPPDTAPDDGLYHPSSDNPPGFLIESITFHEGFRAPGLKAVDVELVARSSNGENQLVRGRDEIIEIVGTSGKIYNMEGGKGTGVTVNLQDGTYTEEMIIQYIDVDATEDNIVLVVLRRDGKRIEIKVDGITPIVTHK